MKKQFAILLLYFCSCELYAEYRVYQYYVKSTVPTLRDSEAYIVTSTLDPVSYLAYHGGATALKVDQLRSWICKGNTAKKAVCKSPFATIAKVSD